MDCMQARRDMTTIHMIYRCSDHRVASWAKCIDLMEAAARA